jgi:hypothetical protein
MFLRPDLYKGHEDVIVATVAKAPLISSTAGALQEFVHLGAETCFSPSNVEEFSAIIYVVCIDPRPFKEKTEITNRHI